MDSFPESQTKWFFAEHTQWGIAWGEVDKNFVGNVEQAFQQGAEKFRFYCPTGGLYGNGANYEIDFLKMMQENLETGFLRHIRRFTNGASSDIENFWEYETVDGIWRPFEISISDQISVTQRCGRDLMVFHHENCTDHSYELDFVVETIRNLKSGIVRRIRCQSNPPHLISNGEPPFQDILTAGMNEEVLLAVDCTDECAADDTCAICLDEFNENYEKRALKMRLCRPGHYFHGSCITASFIAMGRKCPTCGVKYGVLTGAQPDGAMNYYTDSQLHCEGYDCVGTIVINYRMPSGVQKESHPNPGKRFTGTCRHAFLPDTDEGRHILRLLQIAFNRKLIFTVGTSITTGISNTVVWNGIHHKTARSGGPALYGYPDPTYFRRVKEELAAKGVE